MIRYEPLLSSLLQLEQPTPPSSESHPKGRLKHQDSKLTKPFKTRKLEMLLGSDTHVLAASGNLKSTYVYSTASSHDT